MGVSVQTSDVTISKFLNIKNAANQFFTANLDQNYCDLASQELDLELAPIATDANVIFESVSQIYYNN